MTRKLALLLLACFGLWHGSAWALGLGEIEVRSGLNERFSAEIELRRIEGLSENEIIASLASAEDFARLGVQRFFYLSELQFSTDLSDRSRPRLRISSNRPINEPFVNFVVDVRWPTGRMLREYTVLLDPPTYAERPAPVLRPTETVAPERRPAERPPADTVRTEPERAPETGRFDGDTYGVTHRNDTLWAIALEVRPSANVSVQQTMLALQRLNPDAFIGGNINLLKAGFVLQVPSESEIARLSRQDAVVQVAEHNARWRDGTPAMPVDARPDVAADERPSRPSGELRLVAGEEDDVRISREADPGTARAETEAIRGELADAEAQLSEAVAARRQAEQQRQETAEQVGELRRQLELRDEQLARLQQQLSEQQRREPVPRPAAAEGPLGLSWPVLGAALGLLVLLLAVVLVLLRRRSQAAALAGDVEPAGDGGGKDIQQTQLMAAISQEDLAKAGITAAAAGAASAGGGDDESDVIAEADVYMAYGRFSEAARVLGSAIEQDGQRADLRLKLMEVLVETQDVEAFNAQAEALRGFADEETIRLADDLASRLPGAMTSSGVLSQGESAGSTRAAEAGEVSLDFDLDEFGEPADLDSLDIDFDASQEPKGAVAEAAAEAAATDDGDMTLLLDGDDDGAAAGETDGGAEAGELDLDLDLDLDSGPEKAEIQGSPEQGQGDEEFDLDLDLDLDGADEEAGATDDDLGATLTDADPATRGVAGAATEEAAEDDFDFDLELPAEDRARQGGQPTAADSDDELTLFEEEQDVSSPAAELDRAAKEPRGPTPDTDPEFDLTLDGSDRLTPPSVETVAEDEDAGLADLEFDLGADDDAAAAPSEPVGEPISEPTAQKEDDGDLDFDFDIGDLPADDADADASADPLQPSTTTAAATAPAMDDGADEDLTELRLDAAEASDEPDEAGLELALAGDEDAEPELAVDVADDDVEFELDFDDGGDEATTKLELARAYIDMGDEDGAREILDEVVRDGSDTQQQEAAELLARIG